MKFVPFRNNVLIKVIPAPEKSTGGIILPGTATPPSEAHVVSVGPGLWENGARSPMECCEGDKVVFSRYEGIVIDLDGEKFGCLPETSIHGRLEIQ